MAKKAKESSLFRIPKNNHNLYPYHALISDKVHIAQAGSNVV